MPPKKQRYLHLNKKLFKCNVKHSDTPSYSNQDEDVALKDMAQDDDIVASSDDIYFEEVPIDMRHVEVINEESVLTNSPIQLHAAAYINSCIGFDTTGNKIPNELMGQWCFNLSNANKTTQSQVPQGTSGNYNYL